MRALAMTLLLAACAQTPTGKLPIYGDAYQTMPIDGFTSRLTVTDDPLDGYRMVSSSGVRAEYNQFMGTDSRIFFRAYAYPGGRHSVQFYAATEASDWLYPYSLNFGSPLRSVALASVSSDVSCTAQSCRHYEDAVADLSDADLHAMLSGPETFDLRIKTRAGVDVDRTMRKDELRAVLQAAGIEIR